MRVTHSTIIRSAHCTGDGKTKLDWFPLPHGPGSRPSSKNLNMCGDQFFQCFTAGGQPTGRIAVAVAFRISEVASANRNISDQVSRFRRTASVRERKCGSGRIVAAHTLFGFVCFRRAQEKGQTGELSQECASGHDCFSSIVMLAGTMRRLYSPFAAVAE
jgi:hypothetical protein